MGTSADRTADECTAGAVKCQLQPQISQMTQMNTPCALWNAECKPQITQMAQMNAHFENTPAGSSTHCLHFLSGGSR